MRQKKKEQLVKEIAKIVTECLGERENPVISLLQKVVADQQKKITDLMNRLMARNYEQYKTYDFPDLSSQPTEVRFNPEDLIGEPVELPEDWNIVKE